MPDKPTSLTITLSAHENAAGRVWIKGVVWAIVGDRHASTDVVIIPADEFPDNPVDVVEMAISGLHAAVYHS